MARTVTLRTLDRVKDLFAENPEKVFSKGRISSILKTDQRSVEICANRLIEDKIIISLQNGGRVVYQYRKNG